MAASMLFVFLLKGHTTHKKFDSNKWKNWTESESDWSLRWDMMNSLRNSYQLTGMTKPQIIDLLGQPDSSSKSEFVYFLGYSKHGINTAQLTVKFDQHNSVQHFSVWEG